MSTVANTVLSGDGTQEAEALNRLLAQVSRSAAPLTLARVRQVLRTAEAARPPT